MANVPIRMDLLTRKRGPKADFFRLCLVDGIFHLDESGAMPGRGYYVLRDRDVLLRMRKKNPLLRFSKSTDYESLFRQMEDRL